MGVPKTSDGKPIVLTNMFPGYCVLYVAGCGDSDSTLGGGPDFYLESSAQETKTLEFHFRDALYLAGGGISCEGGKPKDRATFSLHAPASSLTANSGGTGNCNLIDPGVGANILIVPAAGNGAYDVNLTTACPVPSFSEETGLGTGFWNWEDVEKGRGSISAGEPQGACYNLFAVEILLAKFANRLPLTTSGGSDFTVPAIKPKRVLPHWRFRLLFDHSGNHESSLGWFLVTARSEPR